MVREVRIYGALFKSTCWGAECVCLETVKTRASSVSSHEIC